MNKREAGSGASPAPPDPKFDVGLGFTSPSSFNVVDDYLDMDDALQSYILSLNDLPPGASPQGLAGVASGGMQQDAGRQVDPSSMGVPNLSPGQQAGMYVHGGMGVPHVVSTPGGAGQQVAGNGGGGGPGAQFMFRATDVGNGGEKVVSGSEVSGANNSSRQKKRREVEMEPDFESMSAEKKQQVMQEKNRLAQRRFRERQKAKVQDLHKQIDELRGRVDSLQVENTSLQSQNSILEKVLAIRDEQIVVLQEHSKILDVSSEADEEAEKVCKSTMTLSALRGKVIQLSCEMLKNMSTEELMQIWQDYVTEISSALVTANSNSPEAMEKIEKLTSEVCMLCMRFAVLNPIACKMWATRQYHLCEADELKRWQAVTGTLDMTKDQKVETCILRKMLLQKLQQLVEERRKLNLTIQTTLPSSTVGHRIALEYLKANQAVLRLKDILRSEHNAMLDFVSTIIKKILKPIQVARLMVQAYPSKPDLLAVASAVAIENGEDVQVLPEPGKGVPMLPSTAPQGEMRGGALALMGCGALCSMGDAGASGELSGKLEPGAGDIDNQMPSHI